MLRVTIRSYQCCLWNHQTISRRALITTVQTVWISPCSQLVTFNIIPRARHPTIYPWVLISSQYRDILICLEVNGEKNDNAWFVDLSLLQGGWAYPMAWTGPPYHWASLRLCWRKMFWSESTRLEEFRHLHSFWNCFDCRNRISLQTLSLWA